MTTLTLIAAACIWFTVGYIAEAALAKRRKS